MSFITYPNSSFQTLRIDTDLRNYMNHMMVRFTRDYNRRRRQDGPADNDDLSPLVVQQTEFYARENALEHHTDRFELVEDARRPTPVFRRGNIFYMGIRFDRPINPEEDLIRLVLDFGPRPAVNKGTKVFLNLTQREELTGGVFKWDARIQQNEDNVITLQVQIAVTAPVGIWKARIQTLSKATRKRREYVCKEDLYMLFNPWQMEDGVYMDDEAQRNEYVMNDSGKIWMGTYLQPKGRRWIFGHYDDVVLPTCMYLLEQARLPHTERGNPIQVARAISAVINSNDEGGLIAGRWDGDYKDGISPFAWTGSVAIMERYLKNGGRPVRYGQCWVFAGATVTVCRALGIPCRPVTNYVSAHDTNRSLTLDKYFTKSGEEIIGGPDGECYDSCWNFHVWSDVWMARPDLPPGYGGWQIIDATPQEESQQGLFRCGPASVEAVRKGDVGYAYDTPFAFSEVNADICHFQEDDESSWGFRRLRLNQYHVGKMIVTKKVGIDSETDEEDMDDITGLYKNPEGSQAERLAVFNAVRGVEKAQLYYEFPKEPIQDVTFDLLEIETVPFGESFQVVVKMANRSEELRTISAVLSASSIFYTGATAHRLKKAQGEFVLEGGQQESLQIEVQPELYLDKLVDHNLIKIYAIANVQETKQTWSEEDDFPFQKPVLQVNIDGDLRVGGECIATFSFANPLDQPLKDVVFSVEGPGLQRPKVVKMENIEPRAQVIYQEKFYPRAAGIRNILGTVTSRPLGGIEGSTSVEIY